MSHTTSIICSSRRQLGLRRVQRVWGGHRGLGRRRRRRRVGVRLLHHHQGIRGRTGGYVIGWKGIKYRQGSNIEEGKLIQAEE